jgi:hypothetical protein
VPSAAARLPVEVDERSEAARLAADDRERERQPEPAGPDDGLGMSADRDPDRQRILNGARKDRKVFDRRAMAAPPGDPFAVADLQEKVSFSSNSSS